MTQLIEKYPSVKINSQIPSFFRKDGKLLLQFIRYYYEWLEEYENTIYVARRLKEYSDVDTIPDKFFDFLKNEFMQGLPDDILADQRTLLKNIKDFYKSKGSEKSFRLLFRILYNEEIEFYYPGKDILRVSDGRWIKEKSLKTNIIADPSQMEDFLEIRGSTSGATARIDRYLQYFEDFAEVFEIFLNNVNGTFVQDELILAKDTGDVIAKITSDGVYEYPGKYIGTNGFLSSDKYIQDSYYYQEYSYEIISNKPLAEYEVPVKELVHPAGSKMFGKTKFSIDINESSDLKVLLQPTIQLPVTDLNLYADASLTLWYNVEFDSSLNISRKIDFNENTYPSATGRGRVSIINDSNLAEWRFVPMQRYAKLPVKYMGSNRVLIGNPFFDQYPAANTAFLSEFSAGAIMTLNGFESKATIKEIYYDWLALLASPYADDFVNESFIFQNINSIETTTILANNSIVFDFRNNMFDYYGNELSPAFSIKSDSRSTSASYSYANGWITTKAAFAPRYVADERGILIENSATNLISSDTHFTTGWTKTNSTAGTVFVKGIDQVANSATNFMETNASGNHYLQHSFPSQSNNTVFSWGTYVKPNGRTKCRLELQGKNTARNSYVDVDLSTNSKTFVGSSGIAVSNNYANGWTRITVNNFDIGSGANTAYFRIYNKDASGNLSYTGDNTKGLVLCAPQVETKSKISEFTYSTKNADVVSFNMLNGTYVRCVYNETDDLINIGLETVTNENLTIDSAKTNGEYISKMVFYDTSSFANSEIALNFYETLLM